MALIDLLLDSLRWKLIQIYRISNQLEAILYIQMCNIHFMVNII